MSKLPSNTAGFECPVCTQVHHFTTAQLRNLVVAFMRGEMQTVTVTGVVIRDCLDTHKTGPNNNGIMKGLVA